MRTVKLIAFLFAVTLVMVACDDLNVLPVDPQAGVEQAEEVQVVEESPSNAETAAEQEPVAAEMQADPAAAAPEAASSGNELTGSIWTLTTLNGQPLLPTTSITAEPGADGTVVGSSGCNNYSAVYKLDDGSIMINMIPAATTLMACPEPVMAQESAYLAALAAAETYEVSGDSATLYDSSGTPVAVFNVVSQDLAGTSWEVISYNNGQGGVVSLIIGTEITADFGENGELSGFSGCNNYLGEYAAEGENISMELFGATRKACQEPEGVMEQENQYLAALGTAATYKTDGLSMNMRTAEGSTVANFSRMMPQDEGTAEAQGAIVLTPEQISLDTDALGTTWAAVVVPETAYDQSMPTGPVGLPEHIQILFGGTTNPNDVRPSDPVMYIIPVNAYRQMWDEAGSDAVTQNMQEIQELNFVLNSPDPVSGYPALPYEQIGNGVNDVAVLEGRATAQNELNTSSATQDGFRFVGRWVQDATVVSNHGPRYVYQGFTNDGAYLVSFWWPVTTDALPDSSELTDEQLDAFHADPAGGISSAVEQLNGLAANQWAPELSALDAVVASLQIEGMPASGLVDTTWEWIQGPHHPGGSEIVTIEDPSQYQVTYGSDGTIILTADCNGGSMTYKLKNAGLTGRMSTEPGPVTLAVCGEESLSESFIASIEKALRYRVWAGGNEVELVLSAGGGTLLLRDAEAPEMPAPAAEGAAVSGMITNSDNASIAEGATATIQIQDTSLADVAATVMGEQVIENPGQFPIAYEVAYDPSAIEEGHTYTMSTRITAPDGSLLFINDTSIPVITRDNPTDNVEIPVIQVGS